VFKIELVQNFEIINENSTSSVQPPLE